MGVVNNSGGNFTYLSIKAGSSRDELDPGLYSGKEKIGQGYEGKLLSFAYRPWTDDRGRDQNAFKFAIDGSENGDGSEIAIISINFNMMAMSLINTLAKASEEKGALFAGSTIMLRAYEKGGYAKLYIEIDGEKGDWLYPWDKVAGIKDDAKRWGDLVKKHITPNLPEKFVMDGDTEGSVPEPVTVSQDDDLGLPF